MVTVDVQIANGCHDGDEDNFTDNNNNTNIN